MQLLRSQRYALLDASCDLIDRDRRIDGADVDERSALLSVQLVQPGRRAGPVELEDERDVLVQAYDAVVVEILSEGCRSPVWRSYFPRFRISKGSTPIDVVQSFAGDMNSEPRQIDSDPSPFLAVVATASRYLVPAKRSSQAAQRCRECDPLDPAKTLRATECRRQAVLCSTSQQAEFARSISEWLSLASSG